MEVRKEKKGTTGNPGRSRLRRIVAWLLSMVIVITEVMSSGISAYADTPVSEIHLTDLNINRIVGQMPDTTCSVTETAVVESVEVVWKDLNNDYAEITTEFEVGMNASVFVYVTLKTGYSFADGFTLYINGDNYGKFFNGTKQVWTNIAFGTLTAQLSDTIEITDLDLNIVAGEELDREVGGPGRSIACRCADDLGGLEASLKSILGEDS